MSNLTSSLFRYRLDSSSPGRSPSAEMRRGNLLDDRFQTVREFHRGCIVDGTDGALTPAARVDKPLVTELNLETIYISANSTDRRCLKFIRRPTLEYSQDSDHYTIVGWDLCVPMLGFDPKPHFIRRFLELHSKAMRRELTATESVTFQEICRQVDYRAFCASEQLPRYAEATLVQTHPTMIIQLHSGDLLKLPREQSEDLRWLNLGDYFSTLLTFDINGDISSIRIQSLLEDPAKGNAVTKEFLQRFRSPPTNYGKLRLVFAKIIGTVLRRYEAGFLGRWTR